MNFLILGGICFLNFVFSIIGYSLREISKFKISEFVDRLSEENHSKAGQYEKKGSRIESFLDSRTKPHLPFLFVAYLLDAVFLFMLLKNDSNLFMGNGIWGLILLLAIYIIAVVLFCKQFALGFSEERSEEIVYYNYLSIRFVDLLMLPLAKMIVYLDRFVSKVAVLGLPERDEEEDMEEEIKESITEGFEDGVLEEDEKKMIESVLSFDDSDVREIMTPRTDIVSVSSDKTVREVIATSVDSGYSRIPVFKETIDNIIGIVYAKDLLKTANDTEGGEPVLTDLTREAYFIPESKMVSDLFREIREKKNHFAVVLDEYGGTAGIVTAEDIIEEIVGEIEDEFDEEETENFSRISENVYKADARIDIGELNELLDVSIPDESDFESLGGFLSSLTGTIPQLNETVEFKNLHFKILSGTPRMIKWVEVTKQIEPEDSEEVE